MDVSRELLLRMLVLKQIHFNDYEFDELTNFDGKKKPRFEAKFSSRSKRWNLAA